MAEKKVALLLVPAEIKRNYSLLSLLHFKKKEKAIEYDILPLEVRGFSRHFAEKAKPVRDNLWPFCAENLYEVASVFKQRAQLQKAGVNHLGFLQSAMERHLHQLMKGLLPFADSLRWYHRIESAKGKYKTAPCRLSAIQPRLSFEVTKSKGKLRLLTFVTLNTITYSANDFVRTCFLLEQNNEYFLLTQADYQALDWLAVNNREQYATDPVAFSQAILLKLEANYPVNRNNHFPKKQIQSDPVPRVFLSELSNSFLMLTPQWLYDGFVVEGTWCETQELVVEGQVYAVQRQKEAEQELQNMLVAMHPNFATQRNGYYYLPFAEAQKKQWFLKAYHKLLETGIELTGMDMLHHFRYSAHKVQTESSIIKQVGSSVVLKMVVQFGAEIIDLKSLQRMLLAGQKAVLLKDSSLGVLGDDWIQQYAIIIKHGKIDNDTVEVARYMAISEQQEKKETRVLSQLVKEAWWMKWRKWQSDNEVLYEVPAMVNATLRPYQQKGFEWLTLLAEAGAGGCLADDMGLGKTLQTICFLAYTLQAEPVAVNIIVCPSSLIYNWQQELQKFAPSITTRVHHGVSRDAGELDNAQVIITSYGTLRADAELLLTRHFRVAVIDESHNIKNPNAQITSAVSMLQAETRIALSGTPVVNNTFDLYSQLNFALPGLFGSREFFKKEYAIEIDRKHNEEKISALHKLTAPFILRRTKEQVASDLPAKNEMILWCTMNREQQNLYNDIQDQIRSSIFLDIQNNGLMKSKLAVIQGMLKLRQVCNSPLLLPKEEQQHCTQSIKTDILLYELQNILGEHKALVFSQFSTMLNLLTKKLDERQIDYYHFDGSTPPAKRAEMVAAFQEKDNPVNLFLISLKAGNSGINLTAADYVFLFDPWWNTAVEQQAVDRTHRIGQTNTVFAYKIICKNTIEEKIIQLQQRKKKLAEELVSEDNSFLAGLNEEDISFLFS